MTEKVSDWHRPANEARRPQTVRMNTFPAKDIKAPHVTFSLLEHPTD